MTDLGSDNRIPASTLMKKENNESPIEGRGFSGLLLYHLQILWMFHYQVLTEIEYNLAFTVYE